MSTAEQAQAAGAAERDDRGRPEPARPGHRRHPAPDRRGGRPGQGLLQQFLDQRGQARPGRSPRTSRPTSRRWIGEIDKKLSAQLNEVMHHPDFQKLEGDLARPALPRPPVRDRREPQDPGPERHQAGAVQGPGEGRRVRPERAVQEDLRGGVRPARRQAVRDAGRRLRVRPQSPRTSAC